MRITKVAQPEAKEGEGGMEEDKYCSNNKNCSLTVATY